MIMDDPEFFSIEQLKQINLWPYTFLSAYAMIPYIKRMRGDSIVGAEIGVLKAETSCVLLEECQNITTLHCVDFYEPHIDYDTSRSKEDMEKYEDIARKNLGSYDGRYILHKKESAEAAKGINAELDFILLDAEHTYSGIKSELESWYPKLKKGGHMFVHDTHTPDVYKAVKDFKTENKIHSPLLRSKNHVSFWVK